MLKQMKLIYAQGFSKLEKEEWRAIIFNNILSAFKVILDAMEELGIEFDVKSNNVSVHRLGCCAFESSIYPTAHQLTSLI